MRRKDCTVRAGPIDLHVDDINRAQRTVGSPDRKVFERDCAQDFFCIWRPTRQGNRRAGAPERFWDNPGGLLPPRATARVISAW
jgi:hypothetical protein